MRINEVFDTIPPIEQVIEEDWKSTRDRMLGAAVAGSMAMGIGAIGAAQNSVGQDTEVSTTVPLGPPTAPGKELGSDAEKFLALTMWGEARNQGEEGMRAVGHVILNRLASERNFGDDVREVTRKNKAFSCWNQGDPNRKLMLNIGKLDKALPDYAMWQKAQQLAKQLLSGTDTDPTNGALFYHTDGVDPNWNDGQEIVSDFGSHKFYKTDAKAHQKADKSDKIGRISPAA